MRKNRIKLTESKLINIINETVKRTLQEGHWNQDVYNEFCDLREMLGDDAFINELYNWLDGDSLEEFVENLKRNYDINNDY